ncbi:hypothetical protein BH09GEM1_BH09GEM1_18320 [soil metagenome]
MSAAGPEALWLFTADPSVGSTEALPAEATARLDASWRELLLEHMPFHAVLDGDRARLLDALRDIERIFLSAQNPALREYYDEAYRPRRRSGEAQRARALTAEDALAEPSVQHIVFLQGTLMEQALFTLQLHRYANAPSNRGWMNLFRRWGASVTFNYWLDEYRDLFTAQFVRFYDDYVRYIAATIDALPLRHPWDPAVELVRAAGAPDEEQRHRDERGIHVEAGRSHYPGVFLDSGIMELHANMIENTSPTGASEKEGRAGEGPVPSKGSGDKGATPNA